MLAEQTKDIRLAYMAGIVDGEGCISVRKRGKWGNHPQVDVVNTNIEVLELMKCMFGGCILNHHIKSKTRKKCYVWRQSYLPASETLEQLLPYLIIKKRHALLAIQLVTCAPQEESRIIHEISELNRTGGNKE